MLTTQQLEQVVGLFPHFQDVEPQLLTELRDHAYFAHIAAGENVFGFGDEVSAIALLVSGTVRVYKISETGREITLYRFSSGESCILTANAILNNQAFSAIATIEQDADAIMIPSEVFRAWVDRYGSWRDFVFELLSQRLLIVMEIVEEVAFGRLDSRVASLLLARAKSENPIPITHQEIAAELGSSREVISRVLGGFASQGWIELGRGTIDIRNNEALEMI